MTQATAQHDTANVINGIDVDVLQGTVQAISNEPELGKCHFRTSNTWIGGSKNASTIGNFYGAGQENEHKQDFVFHADEPPVLAGSDDAANPVEYLLHALASCITTSMVAHASVRGIDIEELESQLEGDIDLNGFLGIDPQVPKGYTDIRVKFRVKPNADADALRELAEFSPVYNTIINGANVDIQVEAR
jgi:uncharacterized OsmC-like protein